MCLQSPESSLLFLLFSFRVGGMSCGRLQRNYSLLDRIKTFQVGPYRKKTQQLLAADEEQVCESLLPALFFFLLFFFLVRSVLTS